MSLISSHYSKCSNGVNKKHGSLSISSSSMRYWNIVHLCCCNPGRMWSLSIWIL